MAFALPSTGSAPSWSSSRRAAVTTLAGFASCCGPASCSPPLRDFVAPLRRRPLYRRREPHYQGPWRLPGPDSHRLAALSLSLGYVITTSLSSWRPSCWTHDGTRTPACRSVPPAPCPNERRSAWRRCRSRRTPDRHPPPTPLPAPRRGPDLIRASVASSTASRVRHTVGMRRHLTEQLGLITQHRDVGDRLAAIGDHHRHIDQHLTAIMTTTALLGRRHRRRQRGGQPDLIGEIGEQRAPA